MISVQRTDSAHSDFVQLVRLLDADLAGRDGSEHAFYAQFNAIDRLRHVVVAFEGGAAVGCGAFKEFDQASVEIKRMYTLPSHRGRGVASLVLRELEAWAAESGFRRCVLETGKKQPEAIALYTRRAYRAIPNYGQYAGVENSVCFEKVLE